MYEFHYDTLSPEKLDAYLSRIGYSGERSLTKETLDALVYLHQCHVPFEDLDVFDQLAPIRLDAASLFDKVVTRHRGGFCFELNGSFQLLLHSMGFDAYSCMGRVAANRTELGELYHRVTVVRLDGKQYVCDVAMGGAMPPFAVEMSPVRQSAYGTTCWVEPLQEGWWLLRRLNEEGEPAGLSIFAPIALLFKDFEPFCRALLANADNNFRCHRVVSLRTADGYHSLRDDILTVRRGEEKREICVSPETFPQVLKEYFGLSYKEIYQ